MTLILPNIIVQHLSTTVSLKNLLHVYENCLLISIMSNWNLQKICTYMCKYYTSILSLTRHFHHYEVVGIPSENQNTVLHTEHTR
jgi:hypothetical protein